MLLAILYMYGYCYSSIVCMACHKLSVVFHWPSPQELQSSLENSKRKRKFRGEDEEEEGEEKPRTKKRKTVRHS